MLLDIMSPYNHIPVNTKAIQIFGLPTAAYFAVLADIYPRVVSKKLDELIHAGYFTVDRAYVESKCGLSPEEQYACDKGLERVGVIKVNPTNPDMIGISMDNMFTYLAEDDAKLLEQIKKKAKTKATDAAAGKRAGLISTLSRHALSLSMTQEVQDAYVLWITAIVEGKKAAISKATIQLFNETMTKFTSDPAEQVEILKSAAASGYTNAEWVINSFSRNPAKTRATRINVEQKAFTGIDETEAF